MSPFSTNKCPISEKRRKWIDYVFLWFFHNFDKQKIINRKVLVPDFSDFPIKYSGDEISVWETLRIVATQMEVNTDDIQLEFYQEGITEISTGGAFGDRLFLKNEEAEKYSAGKYYGKQEDGKFHIMLEVKTFTEPENLVATLAHEIAHIKLLGENKIKENNEPLTDLTTVIYGLGIFNANAAFQFKKDFSSWGYNKQGYLSQMDWGYSLALYAFIKDDPNPSWLKFLTKNVRSDFKNSMNFINKNKQIVLNYKYTQQKD
jgi:hypothetical protein